MHRRTTLPALLTLLLGLAAVPLVTSGASPVAHAAVTPRYQEYVALGDSWSADVVLFDRYGVPDARHAPVDCFQSHTNYPKLVARALAIPVFRDATCGSATTEHFAHPQAGLPLGGTNPPQFDRLTPTTDLVTVGIGGNDAEGASGATSCISASPISIPTPVLPFPDVLPLIDETSLPLGGCKERFTAGGIDRLAENVAATEDKVVAALKEIKRRSPRARVLLVNYLDAIPVRGCWPIVPITNTDMAYLNSVFVKLNAMLAEAARRGGAELVDTHPLSTGHHVCTGPLTRYVEGLGVISLNDLAVAVPAHPNAAGARSQARSVLQQIER
ncbi:MULTISPECIES: SGNH/GDSL hydrolase family protein [unclassified Nocardioides]|uniref:SGNH/GDSL hydrolase family protein n=1 Tax=unclassified Nocardioides TaxID=2615069 RepID=UPI000AF1FB9D|nr:MULTISPECIES: SGNH/GDSL hydrolase family protein [unclassified Nocardioides]